MSPCSRSSVCSRSCLPACSCLSHCAHSLARSHPKVHRCAPSCLGPYIHTHTTSYERSVSHACSLVLAFVGVRPHPPTCARTLARMCAAVYAVCVYVPCCPHTRACTLTSFCVCPTIRVRVFACWTCSAHPASYPLACCCSCPAGRCRLRSLACLYATVCLCRSHCSESFALVRAMASCCSELVGCSNTVTCAYASR
eukprot:6142701-Pleurochrysis_carterae.AAC.1